MTEYTFSSNDYDEADESNTSISNNFQASTLDVIVEKFFWFLRANGFSYVAEITVDKGDGLFTSYSLNGGEDANVDV